MKYLLLVLALLSPSALMGQYAPPADRTPNGTNGGWLTGSDIWNGGSLPVYTGISCAAAVCDGTTDDTAHINSCISALSSGQAAVLPSNVSCLVNGVVRLKSNTALRGTGTANVSPWLPAGHTNKTRIVLGTGGRFDTQNFSFSGSIYPTTSYQTLPATCTISGTPTKGSTSFTNSSTDTNCALSAGMYISIYGNDDPSLISTTGEDGWCGYCALNDGFYAAQQIVKVVSATGGGGNGATITITPGWYLTPFIGTATVPGNGGSGTQTEPAGAKYTIINFTNIKAGYEDLVIDAGQNDIGANPIITLEGCLFCWVKDVETYDTGSNSNSSHVQLQVSYGNEIRDSYFHDQRSGASGSGYGIYQQWTNGDHKIENNVVRHARHGLLMQGGGSGNAFLYNYVDDMYTDDLTYFGSLRSSHGGHPFMNLFEGNIFSHWVADEFIGTSSHTTGFRNWVRGGEPNFNLGSGTIPSFPPNSGFNAVDIYSGQSKYSTVDSILGNNSSFPTNDNWSAATLSGYNRNSLNTAPLVYSIDTSTFTYGTASISSSSSSFICQGNYDYKTLGIWASCGSGTPTYVNSMYYSSEPSFISSAGCAWPAQGSDLSVKGTLQQVAYMRATSGACSGGATYTWTVTASNGTVTGTNCASSSYSSTTTIGPCTAVPNAGYAFSSWSGVSGSATCSGATNPCPSFSITANSAATATFALNSYTLSTATAGTGSGTISGCAGAHNYMAPYSCTVTPAAGSVISTVSGCGGSGTSTYTGPMPASNCTVTATFQGTVAVPTFSPAPGSYGSTQTVTLADATSGATICYTIDGTTPTASAGTCTHGTTYSTTISVATTTTIKAIGSKSTWATSGVATGTYTIVGAATAPVLVPIPDTYASALPITASNATLGSTICYTTDGTTPTANGAGTCTHGTTYTAGVTISSSSTLKAITSKSGFSDSSVTSGAYVISGSPNILFKATLSSNASSSGIIITPNRKQLGNVGTGCNGSHVITPTGVPVGQLYATPAIASTAIAAGCASQGSVSVTASGTGIQAMDNGQNSGGTDSPVTVLDTYGNTTSDSVCTGDTNNSLATPFAGLSPLTCVSSSSLVVATSTVSGHGNSDVLWPTDYPSNSTTLDNALYYYRDTYWIPDSLSTLHDWEFDVNINSSPTAYSGSTGAYTGWGFDWSVVSNMFRSCPQGCSGWTVLQGIDVAGGAPLTSYPLTTGHTYRTRNFGHRRAGCTATSGSNCFFYDYLTVYDVTAGSAPKTYALIDSSTGLPMGGIPVNHSTWASGADMQVQIDMTSAAASTQVRVISDTTEYYGSTALPVVATPTFSPVAGTYSSTQTVTISTSTGGATICYTTDGSTPTADGAGTCLHGTTYSSPVSVASSLTLKAVGSLSGDADSSVASAAYVISGTVATPTFSPAAGTYFATQSVTISTSTGGASIIYTNDGSTPTVTALTCTITHGTLYSGPVSVATSQTLKAIGCLASSNASSVASAAYTISSPPSVSVTLAGVKLSGTQVIE